MTGETLERDRKNFKGLGKVMVGDDVTCEMIISGVILPKELGIRMVNRSRRS